MRTIPLPALALLTTLCLIGRPLPAQEITYVQQRGQTQQPETQPPPPTTTEHLTGVVVSSVDGKPVARVLVTSPDRRMAAMTDYEGRFAFDYRRMVQSATNNGMPSAVQGMIYSGAGGYAAFGAAGSRGLPIQFQVRKPGYIQNTVLLWLPAVQPDTPEPPLQLKIVPAGVIFGHADPDNGQPPPTGFSVQLRRKNVQNGAAMWQMANSTQVNSQGEFRFGDLQPGDYKLVTSAWTAPESMRGNGNSPDSIAGLVPVYYPDATTLDAAGTIHVGPAQSVNATLTPHSATFYRIAIPLAGADAIQGASVMLLPDTLGFRVNFNSQTRTVEGYLPAGSYNARIMTFAPSPPNNGNNNNVQATVRTPGLQMINNVTQPRNETALVHFEVARSPVRTAPVTTVASFEIPVTVHRDFTATDNSTQGYNGPVFVDGESQRMPPVYINLISVDSNNFGATMAPLKPGDSDDNLKIQNVNEGVYHVQVQTPQGYVAALSSGTTDLLRDPLTVGAPGSAFPIEVTLRNDSASVTGTLQSSAASTAPPLSGDQTVVVAIPLDRPQAEPMYSGFGFGGPQPSQFRLNGIPPGRYLFFAWQGQAFNQLEYRNPDVLRDLMTKGTSITLSAGQKAQIEIPMLSAEEAK